MAITNLVNTKSATSTKNNSNTSKANKNASTASYSSYEAKANSKINNKTYTYSQIFSAASKKYNVPQKLLEAVALTESSFRANATSYCGAMGIMQLMPATAKSLGVNDAYNPVENIMGGAKYLSQMLKKYNGNTSLALAAYNAGPGNVAKHNGVPSFCQGYVNKVQNYIDKGVNVPNKTVTLNSSTFAGKVMEQYTSNKKQPTITTEKATNNSSSNSSDKAHSTSVVNSINTTKASNINNGAIANSSAANNTINTSAKIYAANNIYADSLIDNISTSIKDYNELYDYAAKEYNIPSDILKAISYTQSGFKPNAVSSSGAVGLMQLMPATARELGVIDSYNPIENVMGGAKYLSQLLNRYNGNIDYAIAAYTAGIGNIDKNGVIPSFAQTFVNKVLSLAKKGVRVPNVELASSMYFNQNNSNSNNNNNKEETNKKILIDIQV
ncbi:MAG: lytic transglycosylase domain-containing protein [Lachnospiraceae bacterium]|nr:lytic transglycosylase domain-containing protein [Lachnospiraceae bacterium]